MKLETIKELHRHHAGIVAALRKEIQDAEREGEVNKEIEDYIAAEVAADNQNHANSR